MDTSGVVDRSLGDASETRSVVPGSRPIIQLEHASSSNEDVSKEIYQLPPSSRDFDFRLRQGEWIFKTYDGQIFRDTEAIIRFMTDEIMDENGPTSRGALIYQEMRYEMATWSGARVPPPAEKVLEGDRRSIQVWSTLFSIQHAYLLPVFYAADITDKDFNRSMTDTIEVRLRSQLRSANNQRKANGLEVVDADQVINLFEATGVTLRTRGDLKKRLDGAVEKQAADICLLVETPNIGVDEIQNRLNSFIGNIPTLIGTIAEIFKTAPGAMQLGDIIDVAMAEKLKASIRKHSDKVSSQACTIVKTIDPIRNTHEKHLKMKKLESDIRSTLYISQEIDFLIELLNCRLVQGRSNGKWGFCPIQLRKEMWNPFEGRLILPITEKKTIPGGTSLVFVAMVPAPFLCGKLKEALDFAYDDKNKAYGIAFKRTRKEQDFKIEASWLVELAGEEGVIQYLGGFWVNSSSSPTDYYLMLERGTMNLSRFLRERLNRPPENFDELRALWRAIFEPVKPLRKLHSIPMNDEHEIKACHADYKPANILWVNGSFKLIDFGFTLRERTHRRGGTEAYGGPSSFNEPITPASDMWSCGTVLLEVATWVAFGPQGVDNFTIFRQRVAAEYARLDPNDVTDPFHDSKGVPKAIHAWMDHLCNNVKRFDTITIPIVHFIRNRLLVDDPSKCATIKDLFQAWDKMQVDAEKEYAEIPSQVVGEEGQRYLDDLRRAGEAAFFWEQNNQSGMQQDIELDLRFVNEEITVPGKPASRRPSHSGIQPSPSQFIVSAPLYWQDKSAARHSGRVEVVQRPVSPLLSYEDPPDSPEYKDAGDDSNGNNRLMPPFQGDRSPDKRQAIKPLMPPTLNIPSYIHDPSRETRIDTTRREDAKQSSLTNEPVSKPSGSHWDVLHLQNDDRTARMANNKVLSDGAALQPELNEPLVLHSNTTYGIHPGPQKSLVKRSAMSRNPIVQAEDLSMVSAVSRKLKNIEDKWASSWAPRLLNNWFGATSDKYFGEIRIPDRRLVVLYDNVASTDQNSNASGISINTLRTEIGNDSDHSMDLYITNPLERSNLLLHNVHLDDIVSQVLICEKKASGKKHLTNMETSILELVNSHFNYDSRMPQTPLTVICLTDGVWGSTESIEDFRATLNGIHKRLETARRATNEEFMFVIRFVRIGSNPVGIKKLKKLRKAKAIPGDERFFNWITVTHPTSASNRDSTVPNPFSRPISIPRSESPLEEEPWKHLS